MSLFSKHLIPPATFSIGPVRSSRLILPLLVMLLTGCLTSPPPRGVDPQVSDPQQTSAPSGQNLETIRALSQLNNLEEELKRLRNTVEEMQYQQENADRRQQDSYQDIDRRLLVLERNAPRPSGSITGEQPLSPSGQVLAEGQIGRYNQQDGQQGGQQYDQNDESVANQSDDPDSYQDGFQNGGEPSAQAPVSGQDTAPDSPRYSVADGTDSRGVTVTEQQAYDSAFESLKQSRYEDAIEEFRTIVNTWPDSDLADDSLYWMSEANYVNRRFEVALNGFEDLVLRYPDSSRVPEAMLKIGYIQYDIGAYDKAADTFQEILSRFPGHQVTASAETRLRRIQQTIQ